MADQALAKVTPPSDGFDSPNTDTSGNAAKFRAGERFAKIKDLRDEPSGIVLERDDRDSDGTSDFMVVRDPAFVGDRPASNDGRDELREIPDSKARRTRRRRNLG